MIFLDGEVFSLLPARWAFGGTRPLMGDPHPKKFTNKSQRQTPLRSARMSPFTQLPPERVSAKGRQSAQLFGRSFAAYCWAIRTLQNQSRLSGSAVRSRMHQPKKIAGLNLRELR